VIISISIQFCVFQQWKSHGKEFLSERTRERERERGNAERESKKRERIWIFMLSRISTPNEGEVKRERFAVRREGGQE
jgi:hypothetical protein